MLNSLKVEVPLGTDEFNPDGDMRDMADSLAGHVVMPCANAGEQAAFLAAYPPTASTPRFIWRADLKMLYWTTNGTTLNPYDLGTPTVVYRRTSNHAGIASQTTITGMTLDASGSSPSPNNFVTANTQLESSVAAGGMFTIQRAGRYRIEGQVVLPPSGTVSAQLAAVMVNGTGRAQHFEITNGQQRTMRANIPSMTLAVGSKIQLQGASPAVALAPLGDPTVFLTGISFEFLGDA